MKILSKEQDKILLELLIADRPFTEIRKELGLGAKYDIKSYCEYQGGKLYKAYKLHVNNYKKENEKELVPQNSILNLSQEEFYKALMIISSKASENQQIQIENKSNTKSITDEDIMEIVELPKSLPLELVGENYKVKQTSIKVIDGVYEQFNEFCKGNHYSKTELISLALLEFIKKYGVK